MPLTLTRAMLGEIVLYSGIGSAAVMLLFLGGNVPRHLADLVAIGFGIADLGALLRALCGVVATYVVPIAFLFGVLMTMGRMAADREVLALHVCGVPFRWIAGPVLGLAVAVALLTAFLAQEVEHRARRQMRAVVTSLATRGTTLEPGRFVRLGPRVVFVRDRGADGRLLGVVVADRSDPRRPFLIFAEHGHFRFDDARGAFRLRLRRGEIHVEPRAGSRDYQRIAFEELRYDFDATALFHVPLGSLRPYDMSNAEIRDILGRARAGESLAHLAKKEPLHYELELERRRALPLAPVLFALVGVPLGVRVRRGTRSWGMLICAALAFLYYLAITFSQKLAYQGIVPASASAWAPNALFAVLALLLLRARREALD